MERQQLFAIAIVIAAVSAAYSLARDLNDDERDFPPGQAALSTAMPPHRPPGDEGPARGSDQAIKRSATAWSTAPA
ncbi:hypothetical protein [Ralstonia pseudosolanacearum]|uniref:hypothetical protein n=1 Tax=Ralstonia pseudosolanacearum TaxID=1310165 RepID=UPI001FFB65D6|nr:hypothetical protein [Ralstonia pseudosolanacearum]